MHSQSFIENLGLHGPQVAQNLDDRGEVSRQPDGLDHVGEGAETCRQMVTRLFLTADEREHALELAELRELAYEQEGQPLMAKWMRELQAQLIAGRNQGELK